MPAAWPWAVLPLLQIPANLSIGLLRRTTKGLDDIGDRYSRRRRESWWNSVMGPKTSEFTARESFRR